ncbi:MAG: glycine cleavage system protein T [Nitrospirae bacterium CG_4_9_14_3_um_filter_51_5]|nr:MAG: glycine cleavage system protein T [Nitrospirae bacterium CG_4_9_14_3_um_filter_51_5]
MNETPLVHAHRARNAKLVDFAGWLMPIQYTGVVEEYHAVRKAAGLFDVSHMGRIEVSGAQAEPFLQWISTNDVSRLEVGQAQYGMVCQASGGILDDVFVYKTGSSTFLVCVNASNRGKILQWFLEHQSEKFPGVIIRDRSVELAQIAIQGPASPAIMQSLMGARIETLKPRCCMVLEGMEFSGLLSRTGYTGEIGYEWYLPAAQAPEAWNRLLKAGEECEAKPAGLGARDLLRLDVGYLLYGNDMDEHTSPLEASAGWVVAWNKAEFQGQLALRKQQEAGLTRQLAAFEMVERGIPRHDMTIFSNGQSVGRVTSGNFSPILQKGIGLGYAPPALCKEGMLLEIDIRGKRVQAKIVTLPFYKRPKS